MNANKLLISTTVAAMMVGAFGFAYAQTGTNNSAGTPDTTNPRAQTTTTGQTPANTSGMQNQQQNAAPGSMGTDSSGNTNTTGNMGTDSSRNTNNTGSMGTDSSRSMNNAGNTSSMNSDGTARNTTGMGSGMSTTERNARADRN